MPIPQRKNPHKNDERILLIASYREKYTKKSLQKIKNIIEKEKPDKIIVLKVIEQQPIPEMVDARVGMKEKNDFLDTVLEDKKNKADEYAEGILSITDEIDIPTDVHLRKGKEISKEIIEDTELMDAYHIIIHGSKKDKLEKFLEGSVAKKVKKGMPERNITYLE
ncbi:MAG: hypothetical protein ACOC5D_05490 [Thermoplasmatota archaeon]